MPYFGILNWNLKKSVVEFFCQHRRIFRTAKFRVKTKQNKFESKIALFGCFWIVILKIFCHI